MLLHINYILRIGSEALLNGTPYVNRKAQDSPSTERVLVHIVSW